MNVYRRFAIIFPFMSTIPISIHCYCTYSDFICTSFNSQNELSIELLFQLLDLWFQVLHLWIYITINDIV